MVGCPEGAGRELHEVAHVFPELSKARYEALKESIRAIGQIEPIWLHPDGRIIDGRHRYWACEELGIEPRFATWNGEGSLMRFVCGLNAIPRHLTISQKAAVAVEMLPHFQAEARRRQAEGGRRALVARGVVAGDDLPVVATSPQLAGGQAREQAAREVGVGARSVQDALRVKQAHLGLFQAVWSGHLELRKALRLLKESQECQDAYLELVEEAPDPDPETTPRELYLRYCERYGSLADNLEIVKPTDWWAFGRPKYQQEEDFPGSIPGEVYANALYYFAPRVGIAVDPMAGSGMLQRVYDDRHRWQGAGLEEGAGMDFDLDLHLFDLEPKRRFIAKHDAMQPLPLHADWIFLDPPYFGQSAHLYAGALAAASSYPAYLAALEQVIAAMAQSLRPAGRLLVFLPQWSGQKASDPNYDVPGDASALAVRQGLVWIARAYVSRGRQQAPDGAITNNDAKRMRRMYSDVCELNVFEKS